MPTTSLCTVIAKNYVAAARTLCRSWKQHHPDAPCYVLVVDEADGYLRPAEEPFILVRLADLSLPEVDQFVFKYTVVEFCTAVKPFLMEYLLRHHPVDRLVYLDPDILVTGSLSPVLARLDEEADMLVTPHLDPGAADRESPGMDVHLMRHGTFNLGFLAVSNRPPAWRFLRWFQGKLFNKCVQDYAQGLFVDQKFIDYALGIFPEFRIVWDPGCNVALWNAATRRLTREDGAWRCNGVPLRFVHFSTFKPVGKQLAICEEFANREDASPLFEEYRQALLSNGYRETSTWPYTYGRFPDGTLIPSILRRHYLDSLEIGPPPLDKPMQSRLLSALVPLGQAEAWLRDKAWWISSRWNRLCARFILRASSGNRRKL